MIVTRLKKTKSKRQIIVVTHNANIPVNGDAEYIISMDSDTDLIKTKYQGTMDDGNIRKEICDVMEGTQNYTYCLKIQLKNHFWQYVSQSDFSSKDLGVENELRRMVLLKGIKPI